ncbi:MAG: S8 family serine peptidase, partial [Oscillospiraceae bacterium]|nr:S8 family serine peptidase [Oscillospiraceae bacterium]
LHADVINMSWGSFIENYQDNLFAQVFDAADKAGVSICTSAGNSDNGSSSLRRNNYPESPDVSTIDDKTETGSRANGALYD